MKPINISKLVEKYGPGYVAKSRKTGQVVTHAKRLDLLFKKTGKRTDVTISWVPKSNAKYVFRISLGVGGKTWEFQLPIKLGIKELSIHCNAVETKNDSIPLLLGRKDIFEEKYNLLLDSKRKVTVISENSS